MRLLLLALLLALMPVKSFAFTAPAGQIAITDGQVLRGSFMQQMQMQGSAQPMQSTGHFVLAPGHGLIWRVEQPFTTATIITPQGSVQDVGGLPIKLRVKNLQHLYAMIGNALMGDWSEMERDYTIAQRNNGAQWQLLLTLRPDAPPSPYSSITVTGAQFVQNITMAKAAGGADALAFADETLNQSPLTSQELFAFNEVH